MENKDRPVNPITDETTISQMGLTKREYFAGLALQSFIIAKGKYGLYDESRTHLCQDSVKIADELLNQLEK